MLEDLAARYVLLSFIFLGLVLEVVVLSSGARGGLGFARYGHMSDHRWVG